MNQSSVLQPPDRQRVDEQIVASIADAILDGAFPPGSTLPPERELQAQTRMSRATVREALRILQVQGLVRVKAGRAGGTGQLAPPVVADTARTPGHLRRGRPGRRGRGDASPDRRF